MPLAPVKGFWLSGTFEEVVAPVPPRVKRIGKPVLILPVEEDYIIKGNLIVPKLYNYIINGYVYSTTQKQLSLYGDLESYLDEQYKLSIDMFSPFVEDLVIKGDYQYSIEELINIKAKNDLSDLYWEIILEED